jgi:hypothetical protein
MQHQREDEDSSGGHKGEAHAGDERQLIAYQRSQDRDPYYASHLPAHIQRARRDP